MPPGNEDDGLQAALEIRARSPRSASLVLSQFAEERYALDLVGDDPTAVGYLLKDRVADFAAFAEAVRRVAAGGVVLDPTVVAPCSAAAAATTRSRSLTPREREVLELMAEGRTNRGIAEVLVVTPAAVEKHVSGSSPSSTCPPRRAITGAS